MLVEYFLVSEIYLKNEKKNLMDSHYNTTWNRVRIFWYCRICRNRLMFLHGTRGQTPQAHYPESAPAHTAKRHIFHYPDSWCCTRYVILYSRLPAYSGGHRGRTENTTRWLCGWSGRSCRYHHKSKHFSFNENVEFYSI